MESKIFRECDMFGRSIIFWNSNAADLATVPKGPGYLARLVANKQELVKLGATQKGTKVTAQNAKIMALDGELEILAVTAEAVAQDVPGFDDLFKRPKHLTPREVMETAAVYLGQLAPAPAGAPPDDAATTAAKTARVARFTDHGMAATFVADLQAQVAAIGNVKETHEESREDGVASTAAIAALARDSKKEVKYLNAIALVLYKNTPDKLRTWVSASHVERAAKPAATPAPAPVPTPTATTATK